MQDMDDMALLREYATRNSEEAFETLVSRRVHFVYSAALRQVRDPHRAEEITQAVFIILAQKAGRISDKTILTGWLFKTTRFAAIAETRNRAKRRQREQEVQMQSEVQPTAPDPLWEQLSPLLDEALASLGETDRQAVLLRFFENQSLAEVGSALGTGEDTARKRVSRALEKLHRYFSKRGVSSTTAIIAGAMTANSVQAAPVVLAKVATAAAIGKGAVVGGSTLTLIQGALKIMAWTKMKTAIVVGATVVLAAGTTTTLVVQHRHHNFPRSSWAFAGYADPESAFQSSVWAISKGDAQTLLASLTPAMQMELRQRAGGNDDKIIGDDTKRDFAWITGYRIRDRQIRSKDEVVLEVYAEGLNQTQKFSMQRIGSEWKFGGNVK